MFESEIQAGGLGLNRFSPKTGQFVNRTGAALSKGDIVALDLAGTDAAVQTFAAFTFGTHLDTVHPFANVISVGAAHDDGWILAVLKDDTLADDALGEFVLQGLADVEMVGSSAITIGARIAPTSGQTYASAEGDGLAICGIAVEAGPTGTAAATAKAIFDGFCFAGPQAEV